MATLEDAAEELATKLKELDHELEEGVEQIGSFGEKLSTDTQRVEEEWKQLGERVTAFLQKLDEHATTLDHEVQEAGQALATLQNGISTDQNAAVHEVAEARAEVTAFDQHVQGLDEPVESLVAEQIEAPLHQLEQQVGEVRAALDEAVTHAREFLENDVKAALAAMGDAVQKAVDDVASGPLQAAQDDLNEAYAKWAEALAHVEETVVERSLGAAPAHAQEVVEYALLECGKAYTAGLDDLKTVADTVDDALRGLEQEAERRAQLIAHDGQGELSGGHAELIQAVADAGNALDAVKQVLAGFSFVEM